MDKGIIVTKALANIAKTGATVAATGATAMGFPAAGIVFKFLADTIVDVIASDDSEKAELKAKLAKVGTDDIDNATKLKDRLDQLADASSQHQAELHSIAAALTDPERITESQLLRTAMEMIFERIGAATDNLEQLAAGISRYTHHVEASGNGAIAVDHGTVIHADRIGRVVVSGLPDNIPIQRDAPRVAEPTPKPSPISLAKLPSTSPDVFGREKEFETLDKAWDKQETNVLTLIAFGGVGKTALVNKWLAQMARDGYRGAERVLGWSFYSQGAATDKQASADVFINEALKWFDDPKPTEGSPWEKGQRLAGYVRQQRTLLILDGLEPLQHPPPAQEGVLKDPALQTMLRELAAHNPGLCLVTSRLPVTDIHKYKGATVEVIDLEKLSEQAGIQLLKHHGVEGSDGELTKAVNEFDGHALALNLLGRYLNRRCGGDIRRRGEIPPLTTEAKEGGHAHRVMQCYERWFAGRFDLPLLRLLPWFRPKPELQVLRVLGLFDRPAEPGAIKALRREPPIKGLTNQLCELPEERWQRALDTLRDARLLGKQDPNDPDTLDCHPLVREHFGDALRERHAKAWRAGHDRLYKYLKGPGCGENKPRDLKGMAPLVAAVHHGCAAGRHEEAFVEVYWQRIQRERESYLIHKLGAFGVDLGILAGMFEKPWLRPVASLSKIHQAFVLRAAGFGLWAQGRLADAKVPLQAAQTAYLALVFDLGSDSPTPSSPSLASLGELNSVPGEFDTQQEEYVSYAGLVAGSIGQLYLVLGRIEEAIDHAKQVVRFASLSPDPSAQKTPQTWLADALHQAGRISEAQVLVEEAERMPEPDRQELPLELAQRSFQYCDLLLTRGDHQGMIERATRSLRKAKEQKSPLDIALCHISLVSCF